MVLSLVTLRNYYQSRT